MTSNGVKKEKYKTQNGRKGFTLLELIVALGIFTIAITIVLGATLKFKDVQSRSSALNQLQENLRFALEYAAKEMRMGNNFSCPNCGGGSEIAFVNPAGEAVFYKLENKRLKKSTNGGSFMPITSQNVEINSFKIYATGIAPNDGLQPKILIQINASIKEKREVINIDLQTLISPRQNDS